MRDSSSGLYVDVRSLLSVLNTSSGGYSFRGRYASYVSCHDDSPLCYQSNDYTGACSCPSGYTPFLTGATAPPNIGGYNLYWCGQLGSGGSGATTGLPTSSSSNLPPYTTVVWCKKD